MVRATRGVPQPIGHHLGMNPRRQRQGRTGVPEPMERNGRHLGLLYEDAQDVGDPLGSVDRLTFESVRMNARPWWVDKERVGRFAEFLA